MKHNLHRKNPLEISIEIIVFSIGLFFLYSALRMLADKNYVIELNEIIVFIFGIGMSVFSSYALWKKFTGNEPAYIGISEKEVVIGYANKRKDLIRIEDIAAIEKGENPWFSIFSWFENRKCIWLIMKNKKSRMFNAIDNRDRIIRDFKSKKK